MHDVLVGVLGAFDEEVRGLKVAFYDGCVIVNIDVCLNKGNIKCLSELLDIFIDIGVREFDFFYLIFFGSVWEEKYRYSFMYDIEEAKSYIDAVLVISKWLDFYIWFNCFFSFYFEGYEYFIQDPYKLNDEVRGCFEEYELWFICNMSFSCRE